MGYSGHTWSHCGPCPATAQAGTVPSLAPRSDRTRPPAAARRSSATHLRRHLCRHLRQCGWRLLAGNQQPNRTQRIARQAARTRAAGSKQQADKGQHAGWQRAAVQRRGVLAKWTQGLHLQVLVRSCPHPPRRRRAAGRRHLRRRPCPRGTPSRSPGRCRPRPPPAPRSGTCRGRAWSSSSSTP